MADKHKTSPCKGCFSLSVLNQVTEQIKQRHRFTLSEEWNTSPFQCSQVSSNKRKDKKIPGDGSAPCCTSPSGENPEPRWHPLHPQGSVGILPGLPRGLEALGTAAADSQHQNKVLQWSLFYLLIPTHSHKTN